MIDFKYIRNRISEHKKDDLLEYCYAQLENNKGQNFPIWYTFILIKWTLMYGQKKYPPKVLTPVKFDKIFDEISKLNNEHISKFFKKKQSTKAIQILYNQQFYLQKTVYKEIFATQLKLFSTITGKYDIEKSFVEKTGFSILDFLFIQQLVWLYINIGEIKKPGLYFDGFLDIHFLNFASEMTSVEKVKCFLTLLTLDPNNADESISKFKHKINREDLQTMEMSFFTMFPFVIRKKQIKLIHKSVFKHTINYYIYDFLKSNDNNFTTEFGRRLEKYIEFGIKEINAVYKTEANLKDKLPQNSNLTDFFIESENVFIESKATELQAYPSVNPTDDLLFSALKKSLFKAYFEQLVPVSRELRPNNESWGIIITYKKLYWSHFPDLFEIGKDKYDINQNYDHLPAQNVFIIDIYTWDQIIQIIKDKKSTLLEILKEARLNNSNPSTSKQFFSMHLDRYEIGVMNLSYLQYEFSKFEIKQ